MTSLDLNALLDLKTVEPSPIWGPCICSHNLAMIYGWRGVAKTRFAMKLAYTIAAGGPFLAWHVQTPREVLYVDGELGEGALQRRVKAIAAESALHPVGGNLRFLSREHCGGQIWNIAEREDQRKYNEQIGNAKVIIIDNLLCAVRIRDRFDDEVRAWDRILPWLHALRDTGRTIILIHHTGKAGTQLGTSVKENWLDTIVSLSPPAIQRSIRGCEFDLRWEKTRDVRKSDAPAMHIELLDDADGVSRWYWKTLTEEKRDQVMALRAQGMKRREVAAELGISLREVMSHWGEE